MPLHLGMTEGCVLCRQHEEELRQSRQDCWTLQQDLAALREKQAGLKTAMEDRRKDVVSYKVQPVMLARLASLIKPCEVIAAWQMTGNCLRKMLWQGVMTVFQIIFAKHHVCCYGLFHQGLCCA